MSKKKVYIISHSHWDREWYMEFEEHRLRLVRLIDDLLDLFNTDPDFNSFHLDGQTVILEDYLAVRPEKKEELEKRIQDGKLRIGPFYVLPDDFLVAPETHIENIQRGLKATKQLSAFKNPGYFPDTFGNAGQKAQLMKLFNLNELAFGRGIQAVGFNNELKKETTGAKSELLWQSPDGSEILSVLFANWYSNANEIPVEKEKVIPYWTERLEKAEKYALTDQLLMMNGVDHQPVQKNLSEAIRLANDCFPDYEFIHSNFVDYFKALRKSLPDHLPKVKGELTSQDTDGWYTLANTASSRIPLKQENVAAQNLLTGQVEPLMALNGDKNPETKAKLDYAWKELLKNQPHDSVSGTGIDPVHRTMHHRFENVQEIGQALLDQETKTWLKQIDTTVFPEDSYPFVVTNTSEAEREDEIKIAIRVESKRIVSPSPNKDYDEMVEKAKTYQEFEVIGEGNFTYEVGQPYVSFDYTLPEDKFREAFFSIYVPVKLTTLLSPFSWKSFALIKKDQRAILYEEKKEYDKLKVESDYISVKVNQMGEVEVEDKQHHKSYPHLLFFEDSGDIGNEYIYKSDKENERYRFTKVENVKAYQDLDKQKLSYEVTALLPISADEQLEYEQQAVVEVPERQAKRHQEKVSFKLKVNLELEKYHPKLKIHVDYTNNVKDHRLQAVIKNDFLTESNDSESIFEVVTRLNQVQDSWKNPENPQRFRNFMSVETKDQGLVLSSFGLHEYEVSSKGDEVRLTLLRSVGEMGDWGYFPTPEAQLLGDGQADFTLTFTDGSEKEKTQAYHQARGGNLSLIVSQTDWHKGKRSPQGQFLTVESDHFAITGIKQIEKDQVIVRGYNMSSKEESIKIHFDGQEPQSMVNLLNEPLELAHEADLKPCEIRTYCFKR